MRTSPLPALIGVVLLCSAAPAQLSTVEMLIDFGTSNYLTTGAPRIWNNVTTATHASSLALRDIANIPTRATLGFVPGRSFHGGNNAGTTTATAGSAMAARGYPVETLRDYMYGSTSYPLVEMEISGLDPAWSYDFIFCASRMNVTDNRTTEYTLQGLVSRTVSLDPANNTTDIVQASGMVPDTGGVIRLSLSAGASNNNGSGFFYLNALEILGTGSGNPTPQLFFDRDRFIFSRVEGRAPWSHAALLMSNTGGAPLAQLGAVDLATQAPPTWLSVPSAVPAGNAVVLAVDVSGLAPGSYTAALHARSAGYVDARARVELSVRADDGSLNALFYGNSYSMGNGTMPDMVEFLAVAAGHPRPRLTKALVGGQRLSFHLGDPGQAAAITTGLPLGEEWDHVVMQGFSLEATTVFGDPAAFITNAEAIFANVRAHSPRARAVLFQTWARAGWYSAYTGNPPAYTGPMAMHREIQASYEAARANIESVHGPDTARRAPVGDGHALEDFAAYLYTNDASHPTPHATLLAGMVIYASMYGELASFIEPDFGGTSDLVQRLQSFGFGPAEWAQMASIAAQVSEVGAHPTPGSREDFYLRSGVNAAPGYHPSGEVRMGDVVALQLDSVHGGYLGNPAVLLLDFYPVGAAPGPWLAFPELHIDPSRSLIFASAVLAPGGLGLSIPVSQPLVLVDARAQGFALASSPNTSNPLFTATDAHELRFR